MIFRWYSFKITCWLILMNLLRNNFLDVLSFQSRGTRSRDYHYSKWKNLRKPTLTLTLLKMSISSWVGICQIWNLLHWKIINLKKLTSCHSLTLKAFISLEINNWKNSNASHCPSINNSQWSSQPQQAFPRFKSSPKCHHYWKYGSVIANW